MLTIETLQQDSILKDLSPEALDRIVLLSKNDESNVLGTKIGELHGKYDADVFSVSGVAKNQGEKSYEYTKRVLAGLKQKADSITSKEHELAQAKAQLNDYKAQLEKGGDEALKTQLNDYKSQVSALQQQLQAKEAEYNNARTDLENQLRNVRVDNEFNNAISGLKFKATITDGVRQMVLNSAKLEVLTKGTPDFTEDGKVVFRDSTNNIMLNPANGLQPYTFSELLMGTSLKDIIDTGRKQAGGGTRVNGGAGSGGANTEISLDGVKTQIEADDRITKYLLDLGLTRDSEEFGSKMVELRNANEVDKLPIR